MSEANPLHAHFAQMARNNAWSNVRIYAACRTLDHAALTARRTSFFPTLLSTLQHVWIVDEFYLDALEGGALGYAIFDREFEHRSIEDLWLAHRAAGQRLIAICDRALDLDRPIAIDRPSGRQIDRAQDVLSHLFVHQIHHRGQVHAMLSGTHVPPPPLDEWFLANDRPIAEAELAREG